MPTGSDLSNRFFSDESYFGQREDRVLKKTKVLLRHNEFGANFGLDRGGMPKIMLLEELLFFVCLGNAF